MILVFGTTGQVARSLADLKGEREMIAVGRDIADLSDPDSCAAIIRDKRPDVVLNAAAYTAVDKAEEEEDLALTVNAASPGAMALTCADLDIPFPCTGTTHQTNLIIRT